MIDKHRIPVLLTVGTFMSLALLLLIISKTGNSDAGFIHDSIPIMLG